MAKPTMSQKRRYPRVNVYMQPATQTLAKEIADARGVSVSEMLSDLIEAEYTMTRKPLGRLVQFIKRVEQEIKALEVEYLAVGDKRVDFVLPAYGIGIEVKARFAGDRDGAVLQQVAAASVVSDKVRKIFIVVPDDIDPENWAGLKRVGELFVMCPMRVIKLKDLRDAINNDGNGGTLT